MKKIAIAIVAVVVIYFLFVRAKKKESSKKDIKTNVSDEKVIIAKANKLIKSGEAMPDSMMLDLDGETFYTNKRGEKVYI